jgi:hypothetical protein
MPKRSVNRPTDEALLKSLGVRHSPKRLKTTALFVDLCVLTALKSRDRELKLLQLALSQILSNNLPVCPACLQPVPEHNPNCHLNQLCLARPQQSDRSYKQEPTSS